MGDERLLAHVRREIWKMEHIILLNLITKAQTQKSPQLAERAVAALRWHSHMEALYFTVLAPEQIDIFEADHEVIEHQALSWQKGLSDFGVGVLRESLRVHFEEEEEAVGKLASFRWTPTVEVWETVRTVGNGYHPTGRAKQKVSA